jgi:hypothetical protein
MPLLKSRFASQRTISLAICMSFCATLCWWSSSAADNKPASKGLSPVRLNLSLQGRWEKQFALQQGETFDVSVNLPQPTALPAHGRVGVRWRLVEEKPAIGAHQLTRQANALGIYTAPTANWQKVLHALDADLYLVYRAPVAGLYALEIAPVTDEPTIFEGARWREEGIAPQAVTFPNKTPWPAGKTVPLAVTINPLDLTSSHAQGSYIEQEPNDTPEQAQEIVFPEGQADKDGVRIARISGGADDIEYFDNGKVGQSGDDWFLIKYDGAEPKLLTGNLTIPDHTLAAQLRFYARDAAGALVEYTEGRNENERVHQQNEGHRAAINRLLKPGGVYFLRAEANAPGYEVELRLLKPAPYDDPRMAVRQAMYDHLGQVDSHSRHRQPDGHALHELSHAIRCVGASGAVGEWLSN